MSAQQAGSSSCPPPPAAPGATASDISTVVEASREWVARVLKPETWWNMSLGLKRLQELIQGTSSLTDDPVWLLGLWYGLQDADANRSSMTPELHQLLLDDLNSRFWFTYRRDFPALQGVTSNSSSSSSLTSDVGWGCTLRSGQMLMAEAISRCWWGRGARFPNSQQDSSQQQASLTAGCSSSAGDIVQQQLQQQQVAGTSRSSGSGSGGGGGGPDQQSLLQLFVDQPGPHAPFSVHNLCSAGAPHGVVAGQWLGPWVLCKALAAAATAAAAAAAAAGSQQQPQQEQQQQLSGLGLHVHVACDPGGGAPELDPVQLRQLLPPPDTSNNNSSSAGGAATSAEQPQQQGLLLLVPLTLGVGKVNDRYLPQLSSVLSFPQSVGIVGGRPSASLYFVGVQGGAVLYLDPHEVQEVPVLPRDVRTFHCSLPRLMPLTAIDPSLAIGFYCADAGELDDLISRLEQLAATAGGAPLMTVQRPGRQSSASAGGGGNAAGERTTSGAEEGGSGGNKADDWEFV